MAYFLFEKAPGASISYTMKWIDGDYSKVSVIDTEPDGGCNINSFLIMDFLCGRPIHSEFLPTKMRSSYMGKAHPDYCGAAGGAAAVSENFRNIVETFEPNVHQFFPFDILSRSGETRETMFIMIICNRLDTVHVEKSNRIFKSKRWVRREDDRSDPNRAQWKGKDRLVLDAEKIEAHLWVDKYLSAQDNPIISNQLGAALREAGLRHIGLREVDEG